MTCIHQIVKTGHALPFSGSVVAPEDEENPAAHGGVSYIETCLACGARRRVNANGRHEELGAWGLSRSERNALAHDAERRAKALIAAVTPVELTSSKGGRAKVWLDREAMINVDGAEWGALEPALPEPWLEAAAQARAAVLEAQRLRDEVE